MHIAVITFNPSNAHLFQKLTVWYKNRGNQSCIHLCSCQWCQPWTCKCCLNVPPTNKQCKQTGNVAIMSHTSSTSREYAYTLYISHHNVSKIVYVPRWQPSLAILFRSSDLYRVIFMLPRNGMMIWKENADSKSEREHADQTVWSA